MPCTRRAASQDDPRKVNSPSPVTAPFTAVVVLMLESQSVPVCVLRRRFFNCQQRSTAFALHDATAFRRLGSVPAEKDHRNNRCQSDMNGNPSIADVVNRNRIFMKRNGLFILVGVVVCGLVGDFVAGSDGRYLGGGIGVVFGLVVAWIASKIRG